ncbi:hypothetical protein RFI_20489 [Reticulomyxa filosa]|uniref:Uncharacterized protein n=1 Tax=Reticulomyxa filosa TaxID=46433 RepID=X6MT83_RETFI|nr:hypothetical protein RFI_20489 [Reticulomyxa filosa]|eukprot:ETO16851.1 hypothetical protein RFI_20489 [Reticulomyxa filosa]
MCVGPFIPAYWLIRDKAKVHQTFFFGYLRNGTDSTSVHVFAEDRAGVVCSILAVSCMIATSQTSLTLFDELGSIGIELFVTGVCTSLFWQNLRLLTGRSLPSDVMAQNPSASVAQSKKSNQSKNLFMLLEKRLWNTQINIATTTIIAFAFIFFVIV